jgi:hypothetical protein
MSLEREPWAPPKAELAPGAPRGVGLTRAVLEGVVAIVAMMVPSGLLIWFYVPELRGVSLEAGMRLAHGVPYFDEATVTMRLAGVAVGGAVAACRHRGSWLAGAAGLGVTYLAVWAPPAVLTAWSISLIDWLGIGLSLPAALAGGVLGALTTRSIRRRR